MNDVTRVDDDDDGGDELDLVDGDRSNEYGTTAARSLTADRSEIKAVMRITMEN